MSEKKNHESCTLAFSTVHDGGNLISLVPNSRVYLRDKDFCPCELIDGDDETLQKFGEFLTQTMKQISPIGRLEICIGRGGFQNEG